jgi:hypothetical protein
VDPTILVRIEQALNTDINSSLTYSHRQIPFQIGPPTGLAPLMKILPLPQLGTVLHLALTMKASFMHTKLRMRLAKKHLQRVCL